MISVMKNSNIPTQMQHTPDNKSDNISFTSVCSLNLERKRDFHYH